MLWWKDPGAPAPETGLYWAHTINHLKHHHSFSPWKQPALNCASAQHYPDAVVRGVTANWKTTARLSLFTFDSRLVLEELLCTSEPNAQQSRLMQMTDAVITASLAPLPRSLPARLEYLHWAANEMCTSQTSTALSPPEREEIQCHFFLKGRIDSYVKCIA